MKITAVESFRVEVPLTSEQSLKKGYYNKTGITRIHTDAYPGSESGITIHPLRCQGTDEDRNPG